MGLLALRSGPSYAKLPEQRETGCWRETVLIAEQIGQALKKIFFPASFEWFRHHRICVFHSLLSTAKVFSSFFNLFWQFVAGTECCEYAVLIWRMRRYFLKLIYFMPNVKLDLRWLEQMEDPWNNAVAGPGAVESGCSQSGTGLVFVLGL